MFGAILSNILRAAMRFPTLTLIVMFVGVSLIPRFTGLSENLKLLAATPLTVVADANPIKPTLPAKEIEAESAKQQIAALQLEVATLRRTLAQFDQLVQSRRDSVPDCPAISAQIILGRDASPYRQSIVINRGARHGVHIGDPVVHGRVLVGRIDSVGPWASRVQMISDPAYQGVKIIILPTDDFVFATDDQLDAFPRGLARGSAEFDRMVDLVHVELDAPVAEGHFVFTSSHSATVPGGLIVGRVVAINRAQRPQFAAVQVRPWAVPEAMEQVQVLQWRAHTADLMGESK